MLRGLVFLPVGSLLWIERSLGISVQMFIFGPC